MSHTFSVKIPDGKSLDEGVAQVKAGVEAAGGKYHFEGNKGSFSVKGVAGAFVVVGQMVNITITKKPFIISYLFVETTIRDYFKTA